MFQGIAQNLMIAILSTIYNVWPVMIIGTLTGWLFGIVGRVIYSVSLGQKGKN